MTSNVISYPKQANLPMYPNLTFRAEVGVNLEVGQQLAASASAQLVILDQLGHRLFNTFEGTRGTTSFTWEIPYESIQAIPHGSRYRIYIDNGTEPSRFIPQSGVMIWVGK